MATIEPLPDPDAIAAVWDLEPLVEGKGIAGVTLLLEDATTRTAAFAGSYAGHLAELDSGGLTAAMTELGVITDLSQRAELYAELLFQGDSEPPEHGALVQRVREALAAIETQLLFFELEWTAIDGAKAEALLSGASEDLDFAAYHLRTVRKRKPYLLSEPEERILAERRITGEQAWARLFEERDSAMEVELDGEPVPWSVAYNQIDDASSEKRLAAVVAMTEAMEPEVRTRTYIYNTLLYDKAVEDRLRGYPTWLSQRNLENQVDDSAVQALVSAVRSRYDIPQRWFTTKARLLRVPRLPVQDQYCPVFADESTIPYAEARALALAAYTDFSPEVGKIVQGFFEGGWIDAAVRPNKSGGAFCAAASPHVHPYMMLNHGGRRTDLMTLAHELGHGLHDVLAAPQGAFHWQAPLTVAETASTFGESLVLDRLLTQVSTDRERLELLVDAVQRSIATIFRQISFNQFEERTHNRRRSEGELSSDVLDAIYVEISDEMNGDTIEPHPGFERFWSTVPHLFLWPGYVYAYAFGQLFSLSIYAKYKELGAAFVPNYLQLLAAGGSRPPQELGKLVGIDLSDPGFWASGLELVDDQLKAVEELVGAIADLRNPARIDPAGA